MNIVYQQTVETTTKACENGEKKKKEKKWGLLLVLLRSSDVGFFYNWTLITFKTVGVDECCTIGIKASLVQPCKPYDVQYLGWKTS